MRDTIRKGFVMQLHPGAEAEYLRRHEQIWPELVVELKAHGASNYSIFLHPTTLQLFGYVEVEDEQRWQAIANTDVCQRWWAYMQGLMETNSDSSPSSLSMQSVFYMP